MKKAAGLYIAGCLLLTLLTTLLNPPFIPPCGGKIRQFSDHFSPPWGRCREAAEGV
jgi:hypothetical protein